MSSLPPSNFHILIVDESPEIRLLHREGCQSLGMTLVSEAGNGYDAVAQAHMADPPVDLILCDLNMPGLDGIEALRHLANCKPGAAIVLASLAPPQTLKLVGELIHARGLRLLGAGQKPLETEALRPMLARLAQDPGRTARRTVTVTAEDLERGLKAGEVVPYFQPKVALRDLSISGVEALARWMHPEHGLLYPGTFLPLAAHTGLSGLLTETMLDQSLRHAGQWAVNGHTIEMAVNVPPSALEQTDLPELILRLTSTHGVPLEHLVLEVTEDGRFDDQASMLEVISRLGIRGVRLSIDDFGTGYSSMQRLIRLPFSELKLDRSFVSGAVDDDRVRIILEANLTMAKKLNLNVVAEGIETEAQHRMVADFGCDYAQGYLFGRPMSAQDFWQHMTVRALETASDAAQE